MPENKSIAYTVAFDPEGIRTSRTLAKILCASLLRTQFPGDIVILKNFTHPVFAVPREGVNEVFIKTPSWSGKRGQLQCATEAMAWRFRAREIFAGRDYSDVLYFDSDCLALRNLEHLLAADKSVTVAPEPGRSLAEDVFNGYLEDHELVDSRARPINAGLFRSSGSLWDDLVSEWESIYLSKPTRHPNWRDQCAWNRLLLDTNHRVHHFERGSISFPFLPGTSMRDTLDSTIVHLLGAPTTEKVDIAFGLFMATFFSDPGGLVMDLLES